MNITARSTNQMVKEINDFLSTNIYPMHQRFRKDKELLTIQLYAERLEELHEKVDRLRTADPNTADRIYNDKIRPLPTKDELLDEYFKEDKLNFSGFGRF